MFFHGIVLFTAMSSRKKKTPRNNDSPVSGRSCNRSDGRSVTDGISILARTTEDRVLTGLSSNREQKHQSVEHHKPGQDGDRPVTGISPRLGFDCTVTDASPTLSHHQTGADHNPSHY